jgi:uncharacterized protein YdiU (UPF0061 family)
MSQLMNAASLIDWDHSYARLPDRFFARVKPTPVRAPGLIRVNDRLAAQLRLDGKALAAPAGLEVLAGNLVPQNSEPIAMAYAGHQFGHFVPQLGDGRAILLGEVIDRENKRYDIQLKGAGRTPFSRGGDGRAALGPVLREYLVSEAMSALGIPSTRALAAVTTGEMVRRTTPSPGAILTRVASSHIRVGTFQYFAARRDGDAIRMLADYVIARHYPHCTDSPNRYRALLDAIVRGQAELVAKWMLVGFIHGVMNTDNTSIACETIDYGPCAFMDAYNPAMVYSSIDSMGRYAFSNQPRIAQWNLARLAETLLDLLGEEQSVAIREAEAAVEAFPSHFESAYTAGLRRKLGLFENRPGDLDLAQDLLDSMAKNNADFTLTFRGLCEAGFTSDVVRSEEVEALRSLFSNSPEIDAWLERWRGRLCGEGGDPEARREQMRAANPLFIPRNHLVEDAIVAAVDRRDFQPFETLLAVGSTPHEDRPEFRSYTLPPRPEQIVLQTFCGT